MKKKPTSMTFCMNSMASECHASRSERNCGCEKEKRLLKEPDKKEGKRKVETEKEKI